jgi:hypothetical protein
MHILSLSFDDGFERWDNPFRPAVQGHGAQWHDDEIGVAGCLLSLVEAVHNGTERRATNLAPRATLRR